MVDPSVVSVDLEAEAEVGGAKAETEAVKIQVTKIIIVLESKIFS